MKISKQIIEENYNVTTSGDVFNKKNGRKLVGKIDRYGYRVLCLSTSIGVKHVTVHRMVALCHIPNPENLPQINHIDGNKLNNDVPNLEWASAKDNSIHACRNGLTKCWNKGKKGVYSEEAKKAMKLNQKLSKCVVIVNETKGLTVKFQSVRDCCNVMQFDRRTLQRVLAGKPSYNSIRGYKAYYETQ